MKNEKRPEKSTPTAPQRKRGGLVEAKDDDRIALFMVPASASDICRYTLAICKPRPGGNTEMQVNTGGTDSVTIEMPGGNWQSDMFFLAMMYAMNVPHECGAASLHVWTEQDPLRTRTRLITINKSDQVHQPAGFWFRYLSGLRMRSRRSASDTAFSLLAFFIALPPVNRPGMAFRMAAMSFRVGFMGQYKRDCRVRHLYLTVRGFRCHERKPRYGSRKGMTGPHQSHGETMGTGGDQSMFLFFLGVIGLLMIFGQFWQVPAHFPFDDFDQSNVRRSHIRGIGN